MATLKNDPSIELIRSFVEANCPIDKPMPLLPIHVARFLKQLSKPSSIIDGLIKRPEKAVDVLSELIRSSDRVSVSLRYEIDYCCPALAELITADSGWLTGTPRVYVPILSHLQDHCLKYLTRAAPKHQRVFESTSKSEGYFYFLIQLFMSKVQTFF